MSDSLLPYYNRELSAVRALAAEFARAYPKVAGRLRLTEETVDDPHVARLLEGVAFLAARVHHRLDDEFPELTDALLGILYPHYLAPVPSAAILQFTGQKEAKAGSRIPAGLLLETEKVDGEACHYRTTHDVMLWPIEIESARLSGLPLAAPANPMARQAASVLRIALRCQNPKHSFHALGLDRLRFYLRAAPTIATALYELLCAHTLSVAFADGPTDTLPVIVPGDSVSPCGFSPEEALLPWPMRSFSGFRLLTEFFAFPEKFRFIEIGGMSAKTLLPTGNRLEIFVYLDRALPELERLLDRDAMALGCVPAVNLFTQCCDPVKLDQFSTEYRIEPASRRPGALEIWGIERVLETRGDGSSRQWQPFYRLSGEGPSQSETRGGYYTTARRASPSLPGTDVHIAPFDPDFDASAPADAVLSVDALCLNRDLPAKLPFGGGHPSFALKHGSAAVSSVTCLTAPSPTQRPKLRSTAFWPLVSQLSLGHLSVVGGPDGARALREILHLHDFRDNEQSRAAIAGLVGVSARPGTARVPPPPGLTRLPPSQAGAFCCGLDVTLEWDPGAWEESGLFVLASILERFMALHASVNAFVRTSCVLRGRDDRVAAWPARAGTRVLL